MRLLIVIWVALATWGVPLFAQFQAGDVAVIAYNADVTDSFAWVALRDMPSNTVIHFTSSSVSNGWFRWGDHLGRAVSPGPLTWTSKSLLKAGSVVSWISGTQQCWSVGTLSGGVPALSASGDQIFAYIGTIANNSAGVAPWRGDPTGAVMLYGLNFANSGWDNITGGGLNTSFIPAGISVASHTAVHAGNWDNGYYSGIRTGAVTELLAAMALSSNWTTSADFISPDHWPSQFKVVRGGTLIRIE